MSTSSFHDPHAARDAATGLDAELIYLHGECMRLEQDHEAACLAADRRDVEVDDQLPPLPAEGDTNAEAEREAAEERLGVAELNRTRDALSDAVDHAVAHLAAMPAQTVLGVHLKLKFACSAAILDAGALPAGDLVTSALKDAERLAEVTDMPDPIVDPIFGLIAALKEARTAIRSKQESDDRPEDDDAYLEAEIIAADLAEEALIKIKPRTVAGFTAKAAYLARVRLDADGIDYPDYAEAVEKYGSLSCKALIAALARDAAALFERHVAPASDATNEGSDA